MKKVYTPSEIAKICHVSKPTVHKWIEAGKIKSIHLPNGYKKVAHEELSRFLKGANIETDFMTAQKKQEWRFLIVDDEQAMIDLVKSFIENLFSDIQYKIYSTSDGMDACLKIGALKPEIVFLDILMPGMDGFEVCRKIRENKDLDSVKIIIITGYYQEDMEEKKKEFNIEWILKKPVNVGDFSIALNSIIHPS